MRLPWLCEIQHESAAGSAQFRFRILTADGMELIPEFTGDHRTEEAVDYMLRAVNAHEDLVRVCEHMGKCENLPATLVQLSGTAMQNLIAARHWYHAKSDGNAGP